MLVEASTTDLERRLSVLSFQLTRAIRDLQTMATRLDPKLQPLFREQIDKLEALVEGPDAMIEARKKEIALISDGEKLLAENAGLSTRLSAAVDHLVTAAKQDIGEATRDALSVQRLSTRVLITVVALSLLTSILIVWFYVGRNIIRRLTALSEGMLAIAGGRLDAAVPVHGVDEISAMGQAVETFRKNAVDLKYLLEERKQAAARLEEEVEVRTHELSESLAQQTATADVLKVISRSTFDLQTILDTLVESAARLCRVEMAGIVRRLDEDYRYVSTFGFSPELKDYLTKIIFTTPRGSAVGRAIAERRTVHIPDVLADSEYRMLEAQKIAGFRSVLAVPLLREDVLIGVLILQQHAARPFTDKQIDLVTTFADQAVIAIENARLFDEVKARTRDLQQSVEELKALGEVSQAVNSTLDLDTVLSTIVAKAVELSGTDAGAIYVFREQRQEFQLRATFGINDELIAAIREQTIRLGETPLGQACAMRKPLQIADLREEPPYPIQDLIIEAGFRALLIVPLLGPDRVVGGLVVRRKEPGVFQPSTIELLQTFASQSVLAIQNARLFHEIEQKSMQLEVASRHKSQFLANMSHELRTPLNAILGYTELIIDGIYGDIPDKMHEVVARVQANGKHLLGLINDVLDLSKIEAGQLELSLDDYSMKDLVQSVFIAIEPLAAEKQLRVRLDLPDRLPVGRGDERRMAQVFLNIVGNAIKFTDSGEVAIKVSISNNFFEVAISDTGPGIAPADQSKIFEEFQQADSSSTRKKGGTGLGLPISKRIVEMHGGRLWLRSEVGRGSIFGFTIPIVAAGVMEDA
jgi:signal transduction histidine kinase/HAMP domain-containing protein